MLTSQALLVGVGLGKDAATASAAVFQILLRCLRQLFATDPPKLGQLSHTADSSVRWHLLSEQTESVAHRVGPSPIAFCDTRTVLEFQLQWQSSEG